MPGAVFSEFHPEARAAISPAAFGVDGFDFLAQQGVLPGAGTGRVLASFPVVVAAGSDFQNRTEALDGKLAFHFIDPLEALGGGSEKMPRVFFRISRCSRKRRFSRRKAATSAQASSSGAGLEPAAALPPAAAGSKRLFHEK